MAWVESVSPSFRARHESADADDADRLLSSLERTRERLERVFPRTTDEITVVLHPGIVGLSLTNPFLPLAWLQTAPAARRYVAGWVGRRELHVLSPATLRRRASAVPGSAQMLELAPAALYTRRVIAENNRELRQAGPPGRALLQVRWAWLLEGGARWLAGQTEHARPAIMRRLHEGRRPRFPPGPRDAALLGGTLIDLLAREQGEAAVIRFVSRLHPRGPRVALYEAFCGRTLSNTEGEWRVHLARLAGAA